MAGFFVAAGNAFSSSQSEMRVVPDHDQNNAPAFAGAPGTDDAKVIAKGSIEHQGLRKGGLPNHCGGC